MSSKIDKIANHIRESMCIDGTVDFLGTTDPGTSFKDSNGDYRILDGVIFECNDSERGQFFIGWYIPDEPEVD